ncbi:hypothetical protein BCR33DRAFT_714183 [Rhizoclosmatium globosum]|uniref:ELMO domain-containing protein n=1 Tax=Rhizoclosmatium globosum TaxID=329046 RepID=A0A1Y2CQ20_9FUNG|nr:hypothetical protein BCR33DRAFT_714183 [Rhizoclosmatium globosum]|eukprot:ORY49129.1 hypothetical protein BCR33DRAFT_714183 [Rhizoclosmatium globosum]
MPNIKVTLESTGEQVELSINVARPLSLTINDIVQRFGATASAGKYSLRTKFGAVRDNAGLGAALRAGSPLVLVLSPSFLAEKLLSDMASPEDDVMKGALFNLQKCIKDPDFFDEFMSRNGIQKLQQIITLSKGNALSFAMTSLQNLLEHNNEPEVITVFTAGFVNNLLTIIQRESHINICRPATAVIIRLISPDPSTTVTAASTSKQTRLFIIIDSYISLQPAFFPTLLERLASTDLTMQITSLSLINALLHKSLETVRKSGVSNIFNALESLSLRATLITVVNQLNDDPDVEELRRLIVEFQRLLVKEWNRRKRMPVSVAAGSDHEQYLMEVWRTAGLEPDSSGAFKWRKLGFESDTPKKEFSRVGVLGLEMIRTFALSDPSYFATFVSDQSVKPVEKRCPFGRSSVEVLEVLCDHWEISTGYTTNTAIQPFLLEFEKVYTVALRLFFRLWLEMEAQSVGDDVNRVGATLRSHFKHCINNNATEFSSFEREMLSTTYSVMKERQLKEFNNDEVLLTKWPFRHLREKLYERNYEFIKQQRIGCLVNGAWFPVMSAKEKGRAKGVVRYYRLNPNRQSLHYGEFNQPRSAPPLSALPHKIEISNITDILTGLSSPLFKDRNNKRSNAIDFPSSLIFSITTSSHSDDPYSSPTTTAAATAAATNNTSLADFACANTTQYSEWVDGFNMLLDKNIGTKETAKLILELTDHEMKLSLLNITGNGLEIPLGAAPELPEYPSMDFYYNEGGSLEEGISGLKTIVAELSQLRVKELLDVYESDED